MSRRSAAHADEAGPSRRRRRAEVEPPENEEDDMEEEDEGDENVDPEDLPSMKHPSEYAEAADNALLDPACSEHSEEEIQRCVAAVVRRMLFKNLSQSGVPVKREELTEAVGKMVKGRRGLPALILAIAQHQILKVFGLEMRELVKKRAQKRSKGLSQAPEEAPVVKTYVLHNTLPFEICHAHVEKKEFAAVKGLTAVAVCVIQKEGERIDEDLFWKHLAGLGLRRDSTDHPQFGNVEETMSKVAKQRYVLREKKTAAEGDGFVYALGESAVNDFGVKSIKNVFAKIAKREEF